MYEPDPLGEYQCVQIGANEIDKNVFHSLLDILAYKNNPYLSETLRIDRHSYQFHYLL